MWDELTILWNDLTILWNDLTTDWNDLTWNDLTMERNDRIPFLLFGEMNVLINKFSFCFTSNGNLWLYP